MVHLAMGSGDKQHGDRCRRGFRYADLRNKVSEFEGFAFRRDFVCMRFPTWLPSITQPTQGFANALVFFRPRYLKFRSRDEDEFRIASVLRVLDLSVPRILDTEWWGSRSAPNVDKSRTGSESVDEPIKSNYGRSEE